MNETYLTQLIEYYLIKNGIKAICRYNRVDPISPFEGFYIGIDKEIPNGATIIDNL